MRNNVTIRKVIIKYDKIHKFACVSSMDMIKNKSNDRDE